MMKSNATANPLASTFVRTIGRALGVLLMWGALAGCASRIPSPTLYVLSSEPPAGVKISPPAKVGPPWQLLLPVRVPDYLDREALLLPQGRHGVQASPDQRWAELLSSSVPRVLAQDLLALRGEGSLWNAPLPPGLAVQGQLRVALLAFDVNPDGTTVTLRARWTTAKADASSPPHAHTTTLTVPSTTTHSLLDAHRLALWQLAQAIAKTLP